MATTENKTETYVRPPVVVVMGHIDHGKSTLLDYIRKSNVTASEVGGITQHVSAYVVEHEHEGATKKITFLDTPGHEAFSAMRERGATVADIAILVVAADDGVKTQTIEALKAINQADIPYVVALTKIDKPNAYAPQAISSLIENEIYVEGYGGDIPIAQVSAKTGEGIDELLDLILITAELEELTANLHTHATGFVIESKVDPRAGMSATLLIKDGVLKSGQAVCAETAYAPVRIMKDFLGNPIKEAGPSDPVVIVGFNEIPGVGSIFNTFEKKKEAEEAAKTCASTEKEREVVQITDSEQTAIVPIIIKADVQGTIDAIKHEIKKLENERVRVKYLHMGVGDISEGDVKIALGDPLSVIVGFNTSIQNNARDLAERNNIAFGTFSIIYELSQWVEEKLKERTPLQEVEIVTGKVKVLKTFSRQGSKQVIGGRVTEGNISLKQTFKITRQDSVVGEGVIVELQQQKVETNSVVAGNEFGAQITSKLEVMPGDILEITQKVTE